MSEFIKAFQRLNGLTADGIIGKNTLLKIKEVVGIPTIEATAHFVGNTWHETGGFKVFEENLNYSASGLLNIFPKYFNQNTAVQYARKPKDIANIVYANRMGNGNFNSGEGYKFRGRGALQSTGKNNYTLLGKYLGIDLIKNPDLVSKEYALESAKFYFDSNKLWSMASSVNEESIKKVRKAVNGGSIGLQDVSNKVKYFYSLLKK